MTAMDQTKPNAEVAGVSIAEFVCTTLAQACD
jgi:hypothetical protein